VLADVVEVEQPHRPRRVRQTTGPDSDNRMLGPQLEHRTPDRRPKPGEDVGLAEEPPSHDRCDNRHADGQPNGSRASTGEDDRNHCQQCQQPGARAGEDDPHHQHCRHHYRPSTMPAFVKRQEAQADDEQAGGQVWIFQQSTHSHTSETGSLEGDADDEDYGRSEEYPRGCTSTSFIDPSGRHPQQESRQPDRQDLPGGQRRRPRHHSRHDTPTEKNNERPLLGSEMIPLPMDRRRQRDRETNSHRHPWTGIERAT